MNVYRFNRLIHKIKYNTKAVTEIYNDFYPELILHLKYRFGKLINIEEVAQEAFLSLFTMKTPTEYIDYPTTWFHKIADNKAVDFIKSKHAELDIPDNFCVDFDIEKLLDKEDVRRSLKLLDEEAHKIIHMYFWQGYTYAEIAKVLGLGYDNVRAKASRSYKILENYLSQNPPFPRLK